MTNTHGITAHGTPKPSEPGTLSLLGLGVAGLLLRRHT